MIVGEGVDMKVGRHVYVEHCSLYRYAAVSNTTLLFAILPCEIFFTSSR